MHIDMKLFSAMLPYAYPRMVSKTQALWRMWEIVQNSVRTDPPASAKLSIELSYDLVIPLLGVYPKGLKARTQKDMCAPVFIAALTIIARW